MRYHPKDLVFIGQIRRDGSGISKVKKSYLKMMQEETDERFISYLDLHRLSITEDTYIAIGFNSFVVKIKKL